MTTAFAVFSFLFALLAIAGLIGVAVILRFKPEWLLRVVDADPGEEEELPPVAFFSVAAGRQKLVRKTELEELKKTLSVSKADADQDQDGTKPTQITEPQARITTELLQEFVGIIEPIMDNNADIVRERLEQTALQFDRRVHEAEARVRPHQEEYEKCRLALGQLSPPTDEMKKEMIAEATAGLEPGTRDHHRAKVDATVTYDEYVEQYQEAEGRLEQARSAWEQARDGLDVHQLEAQAEQYRAKAKKMANLKARFGQFREKLRNMS
jgi:hypothetical protein